MFGLCEWCVLPGFPNSGPPAPAPWCSEDEAFIFMTLLRLEALVLLTYPVVNPVLFVELLDGF